MPDVNGPIACTLPLDHMAGRRAEFQRLFGHVQAVERLPRRLRLILRSAPGLRAVAADLFAREKRCCPFFTFTVTARGDVLVADVEVPEGAEPTLDGLEAMAAAAAPGAAGPARELRIGEVALLAGVNIQTLRYYERRGLLEPASRRPSGQRVYREDAVELVRAIKVAQRLGFSLDEIRELAGRSAGAGRRTAVLHARAADKIVEMDGRIARLQAIRAELADVVAADCDSLLDCSCGTGCPLPQLVAAGP
jgi:DNA-binding transcriptional MerR regulator